MATRPVAVAKELITPSDTASHRQAPERGKLQRQERPSNRSRLQPSPERTAGNLEWPPHHPGYRSHHPPPPRGSRPVHEQRDNVNRQRRHNVPELQLLHPFARNRADPEPRDRPGAVGVPRMVDRQQHTLAMASASSATHPSPICAITAGPGASPPRNSSHARCSAATTSSWPGHRASSCARARTSPTLGTCSAWRRSSSRTADPKIRRLPRCCTTPSRIRADHRP